MSHHFQSASTHFTVALSQGNLQIGQLVFILLNNSKRQCSVEVPVVFPPYLNLHSYLPCYSMSAYPIHPSLPPYPSLPTPPSLLPSLRPSLPPHLSLQVQPLHDLSPVSVQLLHQSGLQFLQLCLIFLQQVTCRQSFTEGHECLPPSPKFSKLLGSLDVTYTTC